MSGVFAVRPRADRDLDEIADYLAEEGGLVHGAQDLETLFGKEGVE